MVNSGHDKVTLEGMLDKSEPNSEERRGQNTGISIKVPKLAEVKPGQLIPEIPFSHNMY